MRGDFVEPGESALTSTDARIHRADLAAWKRAPGVAVMECVEHADPRGPGRVGVVRPSAGRRAYCPPVAEELCRLGLDATDIHLAIERYMKCGTGHCGHRYVNHRYVCTDGPVFSLAELRDLPDAFRELGRPGAAAAC